MLLSLPYSGSPAVTEVPATPYSSAGSSGKAQDVTSMAFPDGQASRSRPAWDLTSPESSSLNQYIRHVFYKQDRFMPFRIEINGREHRRVVVVLEEKRRAYKVLDLDYAEGHEMERDEG